MSRLTRDAILRNLQRIECPTDGPLSADVQCSRRAAKCSRSHITVAQRGDLYGTLIPGGFFPSRFSMGSRRSPCAVANRDRHQR